MELQNSFSLLTALKNSILELTEDMGLSYYNFK